MAGNPKGAGITAYGIDTNPVQIAEARELGLDVRLEDAVHTLSQAEDASLAVITAHHLIEHLPFDLVAWITREALRVLAPGGLFLNHAIACRTKKQRRRLKLRPEQKALSSISSQAPPSPISAIPNKRWNSPALKFATSKAGASTTP